MTAKIFDKVAGLSSASKSVWIVLREDATASEAQIMAITGYSKRWLKKAYAELAEAELIAPRVQDSVDLPEGQQQSYQAMAAMGVEKKIALDLAQRVAPQQVLSSIDYVRSRGQLKNPAGYLVQRLRNRVQTGESEGISPVATAQEKAMVPTGEAPFESFVARQGSEDVEFQMLLYAVCAVCGVDPLLNPRILDVVDRLFRAGYRAEHVQCFVKEIWPKEWPGKTGEKPTLDGLLRLIGHTRSATDTGDPELKYTFSRGYAENPYLVDEYFDRDRDLPQDEPREEETPPVACPTCGQAVCACGATLPSRLKDMWQAMLGQLRLSIYRSTYETWLSHARLMALHGNEVIVSVPLPYMKAWIERHLLASMTRTLNDFYWTPAMQADSPGQALTIRLITPHREQ